MRELKFRAWDKTSSRFVATANIRGEVARNFTIYSFPITPFEIRGKLIIEQYTGLKDKNGKEIYEGDIIQETIITGDTTDGTYRYEVYWDEDMLCWSIKGISDSDYHLRDDLWETNASREVIGNIHGKDKLVDFDHVKGDEE